MPDPTPTPDTLRAAIEQVILDLGPMADSAGHVSIALMRDLQHAAGTLTAALAASPAPTDSPEPGGRLHGREVLVRLADGRYSDRTTRAAREALAELDAELAAPTESPDEPWQSNAPAAVTAPREDERVVQPFTVGDGWEGSFDAEGTLTLSFGSDVGPQGEYVLDQPEVEHLRGFLAAAAPAVERATPDPDTLAALVPHYDWCVNPGDDDEWCSCWPVRLTVARALIAAGVTLNETATTPTQEDA